MKLTCAISQDSFEILEAGLSQDFATGEDIPHGEDLSSGQVEDISQKDLSKGDPSKSQDQEMHCKCKSGEGAISQGRWCKSDLQSLWTRS